MDWRFFCCCNAGRAAEIAGFILKRDFRRVLRRTFGFVKYVAGMIYRSVNLKLNFLRSFSILAFYVDFLMNTTRVEFTQRNEMDSGWPSQ